MSKPYLRKEKTQTIKVMGQRVVIKNLSFKDTRRAADKATFISQNGKDIKIDNGLLGTYRALYSIVDWDLTDESGKKLPIELKTLDELLTEEFVNELLEKINSANEGVTTEKKKQ